MVRAALCTRGQRIKSHALFSFNSCTSQGVTQFTPLPRVPGLALSLLWVIAPKKYAARSWFARARRLFAAGSLRLRLEFL